MSAGETTEGLLNPQTDEVENASKTSSRLLDYIELTKPRLTLLSVMTTLAGYYLGARGDLSLLPLLSTLAGTFLVGAGCAAFNMMIEVQQDALMKRTLNRPLPAGRVSSREALVIGLLLTIIGLVWLALSANLLAALVAAATFVSYVFLYTPLKRRTTLNTIVGAVPGALPPMIGWAAATGTVEIGAVALFALVFFWQMPHFLALAWMYRKDYARAGYRMLPLVDPEGDTTSRQILLYVAALLPVSLIPTLVGISGSVYFFGAVLLGLIFLWLSFRFALTRENRAAKAVFHFSLIYLPILLLAMAIDGPKF
ncbi:MAG: heme o synthase [Ignavibacteriae bacterium]|nr:heme o synthase [Ignavibacteriota bacterium]MCB9216332.1 protoheme IX farnesyltransferase [Ignavibacteria bacterium]